MAKRDLQYYKSLHYKAEVQYDGEDKCYFASFPELGDISADGSTAVEAVEKVYRLKDEVLEADFKRGVAIPEPRPKVEYSGKFQLRLPKSLHEGIAYEANREGTSINRLMVQIVSEYLERRRNLVEAANTVKVAIENTAGSVCRVIMKMLPPASIDLNSGWREVIKQYGNEGFGALPDKRLLAQPSHKLFALGLDSSRRMGQIPDFGTCDMQTKEELGCEKLEI